MNVFAFEECFDGEQVLTAGDTVSCQICDQIAAALATSDGEVGDEDGSRFQAVVEGASRIVTKPNFTVEEWYDACLVAADALYE